MLRETGTVVRIEPEALWVETLQQSACGSCSAQKGCGQHALAKVLSNASLIRVLLDGHSSSAFKVRQQVAIGIPEDVVVKGSLLIYLVPLLMMVSFSTAAFNLFGSDGAAALAAAVGLGAGGLLVRWHSFRTRNDPRLQPVLLDL